MWLTFRKASESVLEDKRLISNASSLWCVYLLMSVMCCGFESLLLTMQTINTRTNVILSKSLKNKDQVYVWLSGTSD